MRIFNQNKTQELQNPDLNLGKLVEDKLITNYPEVKAVEEQGHYKTIKEYENGGKDVVWVVDVEGVEYQPPRTEIEDIYVYVPYTKEELKERELFILRSKRKTLLRAYDIYKINFYYGIEVVDTLEAKTAKEMIDDWYKKILNLDESAINNPPERIKYYM